MNAVSKFTSSSIKYDIEADWSMFTTCNYGCEYCFFTPEQLQKKLKVVASNEEWQNGFDQTNLTWLINITGGEPSIYPKFADLCSRLTRKHYISMNTNLSRPSIKEFSEMVDPERVTMINAGFHPVEREKKAGYSIFLDNFDLLRSRGFNVVASMVGDPVALHKIDEINRLVEPRGIVLVPKVLRGEYKGKIYPQAYTEEEREIFRDCSKAARSFYAPMLSEMREVLTVYPFNDDDFLNEIPEFRGMVCESGKSFVIINPQGNIRRCPNHMMGNILEGNFKPNVSKSLCNAKYCFYFCQKYANTTENKDVIADRKNRLNQVNQISLKLHNLNQQIKTIESERTDIVNLIKSSLK